MDILGIVNLPNWFLYLAIIALLIYVHYAKHLTLWKRQGVPGPRPWPLIGNINPIIFGKNTCDEDLANLEKYGPVYGTYESFKKILVVNDPEMLKQMLIKDFDVFRNRRTFGVEEAMFMKGIFFLEDDEWKTTRKVLSPIFSASKLKRMSYLMMQCSEQLVNSLKESTEQYGSFNALDVFRMYTMNVFGKCIFGIDIDVKDPNNQFIKNFSELFDSVSTLKLTLLILFPRLSHMLGIKAISPKIMNYFLKVTETVFEARKNSKEDRGDFVQIALEMMDHCDVDEGQKNVLSYESICANSISLLFAGIDTTKIALSYSVYNLAVHPEIQEKLIDEIDNAVERFGDINYDALFHMPYLTAVIDETLRLYPPAIRGERVCARDYTINGIFLPKGSLFTFSEYVMHRNPNFWKDPETFDPSRFLNKDQAIDAYKYFPFLQGPRNCIAKRFALLEVKLAISMLLRKMRFKTCSKTEIPIKWKMKDAMVAESLDLSIEMR